MSRSFRLFVSRPAGYLSLALGLLLAFLSAAVNASDAAQRGLLPDWQEPSVIKNLVVNTQDSAIGMPATIGDYLYFFAFNQGAERDIYELWRTDGTPGGTVMLESYREWYFDSESLVLLGDKLIFLARDAGGNTAFWITDGTPGGAKVMLDPAVYTSFSNVHQVTVAGSYVYFLAYDDEHLTQLWRTDTTTAGTIRLTGGDYPFDGSYSSLMTAYDGQLYFIAYDDAYHNILVRSDGTPGGTTAVKDLGELNSYNLLANDGYLYIAGSSLLRSDGTAAGTISLKTFSESESLEEPMMGDSTFYFIVKDWNDNSAELWKTTGTAASTTKLASLEGSYGRATTAGDRAFFAGIDSAHGIELWTSDGTTAGTKMVKDMTPGPDSTLIDDLLAVGNQVYFVAIGMNETSPMIRSDGTAAGTFLVEMPPAIDGHAFPDPVADFNGRLVFSARDMTHGSEPWIANHDGTAITFLKDINVFDDGDSLPVAFNYVNERLFFRTTHGLWSSDGSEAGTTLLLANENGVRFVTDDATRYGSAGNYLYFVVNNEVDRMHELWRSDGTPGGTAVVKALASLYRAYPAADFTDMNGLLYFSRGPNFGREELWRSDGTPAGTYHVATPNIDISQSSQIEQITAVGNTLFFVATDGSTGLELWRSDGTTAGTHLVVDIAPGPAGSNPAQLTAYNGRLYFVVDDGAHGPELWRSDGTAAGTVMVKDIKSGAAGSEPGELTVFNGRLYFSAADGIHGRELWRSDGTAAGTTLVKDIYPDGGSVPTELTPGQDWLFFVAFDDGGNQPWKTDGTAAGTSRIAVLEFNDFDWPHDLAAVGNTLFFSTVYQTAERFYRSDGTAAGTIPFSEAFTGFRAYDYGNLTAAPGRLFFSATSLMEGNEPFVHLVDLTRRSPGTLYLADGGDFATYRLTLNFKPSAPVTLTFSSDDPTVEFSPPSLTIAPQNWNVPVSIGVRAADDGVEGNIREATITETFSSADERLDGAVTTMPISIGWRFAYAPVTIR